MARYPLNLPQQLKQDAESWAKKQGVSLNQFILWATAEKIGALRQQLDDPAFPQITYRRGSSGSVTPIIRGTGVRVQTVVIAHHHWGLSPVEISESYNLSKRKVQEALNFYAAHQEEIELTIAIEMALEAEANG